MDFASLLGRVAFRDWAVQFLLVLFLVGGFALLAVGLTLIFNSAGTLRFFSRMNRWVSTRRTLRPIEIPREMESIAGMFLRGHGCSIAFIALRLFTPVIRLS